MKIGNRAPNFILTGQELEEIPLSKYSGKIKVVTTFPSLDTPVCDLQVKEFNGRAASLSPEMVIIAASMDLPFAQKRFCSANGIKGIVVASDHRCASLGLTCGLVIKEPRLLARSVFIVDKDDAIRYIQIVPELTDSPDYDAVMTELEKVLRSPGIGLSKDDPGRCLPCEGGVLPITADAVAGFMKRLEGWQMVDGKRIQKDFKFKEFSDTVYFLDTVFAVAVEQDHHPSFAISYGRVRITLSTHAAGGLTANDFVMAGMIDESYY